MLYMYRTYHVMQPPNHLDPARSFYIGFPEIEGTYMKPSRNAELFKFIVPYENTSIFGRVLVKDR